MPRLTSSGQDSCCQTLIAHVARYWSAVLPSSGYTCTHHHHRVAQTYQCSLSFPSGRHVQEGWLDSCKTTNTFDSRWWVLKVKIIFFHSQKKKMIFRFIFFYWKKPHSLAEQTTHCGCPPNGCPWMSWCWMRSVSWLTPMKPAFRKCLRTSVSLYKHPHLHHLIYF